MMFLACLAVFLGTMAHAAGSSRPNFVFIMTDDQDAHLDSMKYQPLVRRHLTEEGTTFSKHFCTVSICCPSRASILTGKAAHNTNVTSVSPARFTWLSLKSSGGYPKFISQGLNDDYLPLWLRDGGYQTYYVGKLMNSLGPDIYRDTPPRGWTRSDFLLDPYTYLYSNATFGLDNQKSQSFPGQYSTDLIARRSLEFLQNAYDDSRPFFLAVAPIAPHAEMPHLDMQKLIFEAPVPAQRHKDLFSDIKIPRRDNFNPETTAGTVGYFKTLPRFNDEQVAYLDYFHRKRLQSLQAVDEMVDGIIQKLQERPEVLANTYIIYTSDNGFHLGQHRLPPGKTCGIEEDVNVPFVMRGPGIAKGKTVNFPTSHLDLAPTFLKLAGIPLRDEFDGSPIPVRISDQNEATIPSEHVNIEYWGEVFIEGTLPESPDYSHIRSTYKTLRIVAEQYEFMYTVWCHNDHELYDMKSDPYQMLNMYGKQPQNSLYNVSELTRRLDTLILTLKNCKGDSCRYPWKTIFPSGKITTLQQALDSRYNAFFASQPAVFFDECVDGYIPEREGPIGPIPYQTGY